MAAKGMKIDGSFELDGFVEDAYLRIAVLLRVVDYHVDLIENYQKERIKLPRRLVHTCSHKVSGCG